MELRDYFRDELNYIRLLARESSNQNSIFRDFLSSFDNDGDVEFLFENFAFLMAKLHQHVDDAFPEITQNLLSRVWPTPIRPIPSTSILQFFPMSADIHHIAAGSEVKSKEIDGESCIYQTVRDMSIVPLEVKQCNLTNTPTGCKIALKIKWNGSLSDDKTWHPMPMTFFLSVDTHVAGLLQLWFQQYLTKVIVNHGGKEFHLSTQVVQSFQPASDKLVLPLDIKFFWRLQLLQEYFHLPHVNDFITVDLRNELNNIVLDKDGTFTLIFQFDNPLLMSKQIESKTTFLTNCVPMINIYQHITPVFDFNSGQSDYTLHLARDNRIFQINAIYSPLEPGQIEGRGKKAEYWPITQFTTNHFGYDNKIYYQTMFKSNVVGQPKNIITFIDSHGDHVTHFEHKNYVCDVFATNGDRAGKLAVEDINLPTLSITNNLRFHNITKPTSEIPPLIDSHRHWSIISHFSLSTLFLKDSQAIKQLIIDLNYNSYLNAPLKKKNDKQRQGIVSVDSKLIDWIWDGSMKRGIEMTITFDPEHFEDEGEMYRFGLILAHVFPFCITSNNFLMMKIVNQQTGRIWSLEPIKGSREQI